MLALLWLPFVSFPPCIEISSNNLPAWSSEYFNRFSGAGTAAARDTAAKRIANSPLAVSAIVANALSTRVMSESDREYVNKQIARAQLNRSNSRSTRWMADKRLDLLVESAGLIQEHSDRRIVVDALLGLVADMHGINQAHGNLSKTNYVNDVHRRWFGLDRSPGMAARSVLGPNVELVAKIERRNLVIAGKAEILASLRSECMFITRGQIVEKSPYNEWQSSIIVSNSALMDVLSIKYSDSIVIVDGDFDCTGAIVMDKSTIFVNGSIKSTNRFVLGSSYLAATGDIKLPKLSTGNSTIYSPGKINVPENARLNPMPKSEPFGIRFFQLSDVGIAAKAHPKGAEITAISPFSPLRLFGLRVGDVVTKVDDRAIDSPDALRRATRTAYVREAGVYYLLRNGQAIDRIVLFGDYQLPK
ncbi:MAG: PDZ domain-containing protein [Gemmataceae bacterium]|nr:PDZ domain-containing protein [Gemmataceae bacterium]